MKSLQYFFRRKVSGPVAAAAVALAVLSAPVSAQNAGSEQEQFAQANDALLALAEANNQLRTRIAVQEELIASLVESIDHATLLADEDNSPLNGLIDRMINDIEQFVEADLPFELDDRRQQVSRIRNLINNPQAPLAQKLSMLISLYQAENAYGRTMDTYDATMIINGEEQEVTLTRIGRIMLAYQSADRRVTAVWDKTQSDWVEVSPGEYRTAVNRAQQVASGNLAAEMLMLPVPAPVAAR